MRHLFVNSYRTIFFLGLIAVPLIYWPPAEIAYEIPKVWLTWRWIELLSLLGLISLIFNFGSIQRKIDNGLAKLLLTYLIVIILSTLLGVDHHKSWWGNYYRGDGLITLFHLLGLTTFLWIFAQSNWRRPAAIATTIGAIVIASWSVLEFITSHGNLVKTSFGNPNFLAGFLVVSLPLVWFLQKTSSTVVNKLVWSGTLIIEVTAILTTRTWAGILSILIFITMVKNYKNKNSWSWKLVIGAIIVVLFGSIWWSHNQKSGFQPEGRERIIQKILRGVAIRPILGYGWANVDYAFNAGIWPIKFEEDVYVDKAHGILLETLATSGVIGLIVYGGILLYTGKKLFAKVKKTTGENKLWHQSMLTLFVLYLIHSQTNIISISEEIWFWTLIGLEGSKTP